MANTQDYFLLDCDTYDEYVDSYIRRDDIRYLRSIHSCRAISMLGYRSPTRLYTQDEYYKRKQNVHEALFPSKKGDILFSINISTDDPVVKEFALREKTNVQKMISTIIFMTHRRKSGFEVSGYIDYEASLRKANLHIKGSTDWAGVFSGRSKLRPLSTDLSFFDWHSGQVLHNHSDNYLVQHDVDLGLVFMHKGDQKIICVNMEHDLGSCTRYTHFSDCYGYVVFYDHILHKKI